jgi:hypothetical protein
LEGFAVSDILVWLIIVVTSHVREFI